MGGMIDTKTVSKWVESLKCKKTAGRGGPAFTRQGDRLVYWLASPVSPKQVFRGLPL